MYPKMNSCMKSIDLLLLLLLFLSIPYHFLPMELCSDEQFQPCFMDSLYLPSHIPSSFYYQHEIVPTGSNSLLTETINGATMKQEKDLEKRRKKTDVSCVTTAQSKSKGRRRNNGGSGKKQMEEKQPPTDYIHVRARRGQATDSHSLAERVRRERISERMKTLQGLVPGCDKVSGKASVLDEIINYVESLKSQIEFLSMKLAAVTPILSDFGLSFDEFTNATENVDDGQQLLQSMVQSSDNHSLRGMASSSTLVFSGHEPTFFHQDNGNFYMQNEEVDHEFELCNMYSFQWMGETDETINHESSDY